MKTGARLAGLLVVLWSQASVAQTDELIAEVDLKFLKVTEQVVGFLCLGEDECYPWAHGYLFEARVRKIISGQAPKKFLVIYGHHAMYQRNQKKVVAKFNKLTDGTDGAEYQIVATAIHHPAACFDWWGRDGQGPVEQPKTGELLQCFVPENAGVTPTNDEALLRDAEQTLRAANQAYNKALIDGDVAALAKIFADEFTYTTTSGEVLDKAAQLEQFKSNTLDIESGAGGDEKVQIHGRTGLVVGRFDAKGTYAGKAFDSIERYTSVWVVREGRWQLVAEQGTLVVGKR